LTKVANILETCLYQLAGLLFGVSNGGAEVVVFEAYELRIEHCVVEGFVAKDFFDMEDISGFAIFHRCFPVAESVEGDLIYSRVF
jgi:hypothetical protein